MNAVEISRAGADDAGVLTEIAFAAKRHWGYPEDWIQRWRDVLTITPAYIAANRTFVARVEHGGAGGKIVGFGAVQCALSGDWWMDHLWVIPSAMGSGVGRKLFEACEGEVRSRGALRLNIEADPHAEEFYSRMGVRIVGRKPAFMDGQERFLPLMEKVLG